MTIARTTIKNVQLVKVGTWGGMTGRSTITEQHLNGAVAAYADPEVDRGVIKIGHDGDLNLGTGHPALGWIENLKLSEDKKTLIGDLTDIPSKLASIIPKAFRRRSVEMSLGVTTPSGKQYAAALTGLALLGAKAPAVKGLADILEFYASESPGLEDDAKRDSIVTFAIDDDADTTTVPHGDGAPGESGNGSTENGNAPNERTADMAITDALKKKLGLPETATDAEVEAALEAATLAAPADPAGTPGAGTPTGTPAAGTGTAAAPAGTPAAPAAPNAAAAPGVPAGGAQLAEGAAPATVVVSAVQFADMQAQLASLTTSAAADRKKKALDNAIATGRISPAERVQFAAVLDANEEAGTTLLNSLAPRIAVVEFGADHAPQGADAELDAMLKAADEAGL